MIMVTKWLQKNVKMRFFNFSKELLVHLVHLANFYLIFWLKIAKIKGEQGFLLACSPLFTLVHLFSLCKMTNFLVSLYFSCGNRKANPDNNFFLSNY